MLLIIDALQNACSAMLVLQCLFFCNQCGLRFAAVKPSQILYPPPPCILTIIIILLILPRKSINTNEKNLIKWKKN